MIRLNDILKLNKLDNVRIRFNLMFEENWNPIELFKNGDISTMMNGQYWNYSKSNVYGQDQVTIGLVKIKPKENLWLLFHVGQVTRVLNKLNGVGYEYKSLPEYDKYVGRLVVRFTNTAQALVRKAESVIDDCFVAEILSDTFDNDLFPGYENVDLSWLDLKRVLEKEKWKTALENQKGVYLITDQINGKMYVGSAYGSTMVLGRWRAYVSTAHGGNKDLRKLSSDYIKTNFRYSILEVFKSTTTDEVILSRESWWKSILQTRKFGYNKN